MKQDQIFRNKLEAKDFKFDANVAGVFDDMVNRSVPFYMEFQRMIGELAKKHVKPGTTLYDLGCSTGTTMLLIDDIVDPSVKFVGMDSSVDMIAISHENFARSEVKRPYQLITNDITQTLTITNASVVILCLTLQFIRPIHRVSVLDKIARQINEKGAIIIIEKILAENEAFNREMIDYYYDFKRRNHYNDMEIAQKREALENVLVPYKLSENIELLQEAGFKTPEVFFKWYNFAGFIAIK